jgi:hypothetical protein
LQRDAAVGTAWPVYGNGERKGIGFGQTDFTGGWQHLHSLEYFAFRDKRNPLDLEAALARIGCE